MGFEIIFEVGWVWWENGQKFYFEKKNQKKYEIELKFVKKDF